MFRRLVMDSSCSPAVRLRAQGVWRRAMNGNQGIERSVYQGVGFTIAGGLAPNRKRGTMRKISRRSAAVTMTAVLALGGTAVLSGCSSSDTSTPATSASDMGEQMIGPVIVEPGQTEVSMAVGRTVVFNVVDPTKETIATDDATIVSVTPGRDDGSAIFNPGGEALSVGTANVTLTNVDTGAVQIVIVTVTE